MENKTGKYFKYAVGEIILVVIGILIALQINNWNELQKKRNLKTEYVVSLTIDFTKDTIQLNDRLKRNKEMLKGLTLSKDSIINGHFKTLEDFEKHYRNGLRGGSRTINTYNTNSFNLLISSGNIDLLNKQLREEIMELNRLQDFEKEISAFNREILFKVVENVVFKYPTTDNSFNSEVLNKLWQKVKKDELPKDIISLIGQNEFTINRYIELTEDVLQQTEVVLKQLHSSD